MGFCVALLAPVGDLFESMLKRDLRIKDSGTIFGPHGGLLDRLDAVLFTIVAGYYLAIAVRVLRDGPFGASPAAPNGCR